MYVDYHTVITHIRIYFVCVYVCVCLSTQLETIANICFLLVGYVDWIKNLGNVRKFSLQVKVKVVFRRVQGHSLRLSVLLQSLVVTFHFRLIHFQFVFIILIIIIYLFLCQYDCCFTTIFVDAGILKKCLCTSLRAFVARRDIT